VTERGILLLRALDTLATSPSHLARLLGCSESAAAAYLAEPDLLPPVLALRIASWLRELAPAATAIADDIERAEHAALTQHATQFMTAVAASGKPPNEVRQALRDWVLNEAGYLAPQKLDQVLGIAGANPRATD
jgi:hypothetical protein